MFPELILKKIFFIFEKIRCDIQFVIWSVQFSVSYRSSQLLSLHFSRFYYFYFYFHSIHTLITFSVLNSSFISPRKIFRWTTSFSQFPNNRRRKYFHFNCISHAICMVHFKQHTASDGLDLERGGRVSVLMNELQLLDFRSETKKKQPNYVVWFKLQNILLIEKINEIGEKVEEKQMIVILYRHIYIYISVIFISLCHASVFFSDIFHFDFCSVVVIWFENTHESCLNVYL